MTPVEAVTLVVDRLVASAAKDGPTGTTPRLEDWLCSIGEGGRAAVTRDAVTWVTACRTQVRWPPHDVGRHETEAGIATVCKDVLSLRARIDLGPGEHPA